MNIIFLGLIFSSLIFIFQKNSKSIHFISTDLIYFSTLVKNLLEFSKGHPASFLVGFAQLFVQPICIKNKNKKNSSVLLAYPQFCGPIFFDHSKDCHVEIKMFKWLCILFFCFYCFLFLLFLLFLFVFICFCFFVFVFTWACSNTFGLLKIMFYCLIGTTCRKTDLQKIAQKHVKADFAFSSC